MTLVELLIAKAWAAASLALCWLPLIDMAFYVFFLLAQLCFPLLGVGIGYLTGFGAKKMFKGTDHTLGIIAAVIALTAVVGTLYLMYGEFPIFNIISVIVSVSVAYRTSAGS